MFYLAKDDQPMLNTAVFSNGFGSVKSDARFYSEKNFFAVYWNERKKGKHTQTVQTVVY